MRKLYIIFSFLFLLCAHAFGQSEQVVARTKVIYIYNFTQFIEWPPDYRDGDFVIGVLNASPELLHELNELAAKKTAGAQKFVIKNYKSVGEISKCNILYLPENSNAQLPDVVKKLHGQSTLLITDTEGDVRRGAAINFVWKNHKQEFELNKANAEKNNLMVSSSLGALAITNVE